MDATKLPKGQSLESNTDGRPRNLPGVYRHTDTGSEFITAAGGDGEIQADALMSPIWWGAWVRIGDVPSKTDLQKQREAQEKKEGVVIDASKLSKTDEAPKASDPAPGEGANYEPA